MINVIDIDVRNKKVFKAVFDALYPSSYLLATKITGSRALAEDIVQEAFLYVWQTAKVFPNIKAVKSYLYLCVKNKCLNAIKSGKHDILNPVDLNENIADGALQIDKMIIEVEIKNKILSEINKLTEIKRKIMMLRLQEKSYDEISHELNLSLNTVKMHKKEVYKILKNNLGDLL